MFSSFARRSLLCTSAALLTSAYVWNNQVKAIRPHMLDYLDEQFVVMSGRSNQTLADQVAAILSKPLSKVEIGTYADGEISIRLGENVRGKDVYIIQGTCPPVNDNILELILLIASARRCSARRIIAIMPYYAYARQDRTRIQRPGIAADDIATMLECAGADQIVSIDIHRTQLEGCFDASECQFDSLETFRAALPVLLEKDLYNPIIVCPSDTGIHRARKLQALMLEEGIWSSIAFVTTSKADQTIEFAELESHEKIAGQKSEVVGTVEGGDVIIIDDMIDTGTRLSNAAKICHENGAARIFAFATHGLFTEDAIDKINKSPLEEVIVTNSIYPPKCWEHDNLWTNKITYISIAPIIAEAIRKMQLKNSLSGIRQLG